MTKPNSGRLSIIPANLDPEAARLAGGDYFPAAQLHEVRP